MKLERKNGLSQIAHHLCFCEAKTKHQGWEIQCLEAYTGTSSEEVVPFSPQTDKSILDGRCKMMSGHAFDHVQVQGKMKHEITNHWCWINAVRSERIPWRTRGSGYLYTITEQLEERAHFVLPLLSSSFSSPPFHFISTTSFDTFF